MERIGTTTACTLLGLITWLGSGCAEDARPEETQAMERQGQREGERGPSAATQRGAHPVPPLAQNQKERWGVEVVGVHVSAGGYMLDFRYRVTDPEKAMELFKRQNKPYLIDQLTGRKLLVPNTPKVGPLRQTTRKPEAGRVYYALFGNPGCLVKTGGKVTVVIGDFRAEDILVQ